MNVCMHECIFHSENILSDCIKSQTFDSKSIQTINFRQSLQIVKIYLLI